MTYTYDRRVRVGSYRKPVKLPDARWPDPADDYREQPDSPWIELDQRELAVWLGEQIPDTFAEDYLRWAKYLRLPPTPVPKLKVNFLKYDKFKEEEEDHGWELTARPRYRVTFELPPAVMKEMGRKAKGKPLDDVAKNYVDDYLTFDWITDWIFDDFEFEMDETVFENIQVRRGVVTLDAIANVQSKWRYPEPDFYRDDY